MNQELRNRVAAAHGRVGAAKRWHPPDHPAVQAAVQALQAANAAAQVNTALDVLDTAAPALNDEQRARIARVLDGAT